VAKLRVDKPSDVSAEARTGYLLQCAPGLAKVLQKELTFVGATSRDQKLFVKLQRNHDLIFANQVKSDLRLDEIRTAEMILKCPAYGRFKISQRQLALMAQTLTLLGPRRLVVSVAGRVFQRQDLARFLTKSMAERGYEFNDDIEDEVWMFCIDESWYFGLPLFKSRALREDRAAEREGALPPTVAAAMAFVSVPRASDVVLDPCCGSGTLLAEFHTYARAAKLVGRDIDPAAVKIARRNLASLTGAPESEIDIAQADSRTASGPEGLTLTLANLPFGVQFGDRATNPALYRDLIRASLETASNDWRGLFLTSDTEAFAQAVRDLPLAAPEVTFKAKIRGELATCFKLKRS
jgi:23S rRNA G2445 N2-methylase RlmL